jgi:hypothetical protein
MQRIACDRTVVLPKLASSYEPLRQAVDVQVAHSLLLLECVRFVSAPRRVLMRCMTRCEVVVCLTGHLFYFLELPCPSVILVNVEETLMCPVGKVP